MRLEPARRRNHRSGVAMIEATIGTFILILGALGSVQIALYLHGSLAAYSTAAELSRTYALTQSNARVAADFADLNETTFSFLHWDPPRCRNDGDLSRCEITGHLPILVPGAQFLSGNQVSASGAYPRPGRT